MGILNSLGVLVDGSIEGMSTKELTHMAWQNAQKLHRTLGALLDLAALESHTFHVKLREIDLDRVVRSKIEERKKWLTDSSLGCEIESLAGGGNEIPVLADPLKFARAIELALEVSSLRASTAHSIQIRISSTRVDFGFSVEGGKEALWDNAWLQAQAGFHGGVASPSSAFAGVMQSEEKFLTRSEEGLGSELLILHEIMRLHSGKLLGKRVGAQVQLSLWLPELSSEDGVRAVLASRSYGAASDLSSVVLAIVGLPKGEVLKTFRSRLKQCLFRSSDAVYALPEKDQLALVMDDCKPEDAPALLKRLESKVGQNLKFGLAHFPTDSLDPDQLLKLAEKRLTRATPTRSSK